MSKKLLTIFSIILIFFAMSCNNKSTDSKGPDYTDPIDPPASRPLKDSQYVGKWYEEISNDRVIEIKQDGSIDLLDQTKVLASVSGTDVIKEGDAVFKATFSKEGQTAEIVLTFTNSTTGSMLLDKNNTITIVKK
ncbi:hypothetical protein WESB_1880 [Brachyspira pilosicoli WesB]|uniref:Lipocalin-like domain-containing protein n=1 Tax=Brachyspira pilosicoli WesB TaxID=1161918 RepID=K0JLN3_BRAPL|nr:hypothetical protein [Brachyspira pilosicoli]CCG57345.1 hypothetical protein WESB_1880 [Brachyspira pilosicoli WesB]